MQATSCAIAGASRGWTPEAIALSILAARVERVVRETIGGRPRTSADLEAVVEMEQLLLRAGEVELFFSQQPGGRLPAPDGLNDSRVNVLLSALGCDQTLDADVVIDQLRLLRESGGVHRDLPGTFGALAGSLINANPR